MELKTDQTFRGFGAVIGVVFSSISGTHTISVLGLDRKVYECEPISATEVCDSVPNLGNIVVISCKSDGKYRFWRPCTPEESGAFIALMPK